ncbi:hypothetical protein [Aquariibacter lacus]|uniref:hypothetical protein n=1 Tax=Aquariibacter lacus TaxID=2801332 RepID=UPI0025725D29|nr:hypothetical protein [Piscinibacter lacus]
MDCENLAKILNLVGIALNLIGVVVLYLASPLNVSVVDGGDLDAPAAKNFEEHAAVKKNNRRMTWAVFLIIQGCIFQFVGNLLA